MSDKQWSEMWEYVGPAIVILAVCLGIGGCIHLVDGPAKKQDIEQPSKTP